MGSRWLAVLPLCTLLIVGGFFAYSLTSGRNPESIGSPLVGQPAPVLDLAPLVDGGPRLQRSALEGKVVLVNFFASWCAPCRLEHPLLMSLAKRGAVAIVGIDYKDKPEDARKLLDQLGNPYALIGSDRDGRTFIDWGLTGVPESFLLDRRTMVHRHFRGVLTEADIRDQILPLAAEAAK